MVYAEDGPAENGTPAFTRTNWRDELTMTSRQVPLCLLAVTICFLMTATSLATEPALPTQAKSVQKIVSDGRHNAFAAFVKWQGQYWLAFRKGTGHVARDGGDPLTRPPALAAVGHARRFR